MRASGKLVGFSAVTTTARSWQCPRIYEARRVSAVLDTAVRERLVGRLRVAAVTLLAANIVQGVLGGHPFISVRDPRFRPHDSEVAGRAAIRRSGPRDLRSRDQRDRQNNREHRHPHCVIPPQFRTS